MAFVFELPEVGEGVVEAEVVSWNVAEGDWIETDQPLCEITTDKAQLEISSPKTGRVLKLHGQPGDIIKVHTPLVDIDTDGAVSDSAPPKAAAPKAEASAPKAAPPAAAPAKAAPPPAGGPPRAAPAVRREARELGVDLHTVVGSGPGGRITKDDLQGSSAPLPVRAPALQAVTPTGEEERIKILGIRRKIAEQMTLSKHTAAHFTYVEEVDCGELVALRTKMKRVAADKGIKLTYIPIVMKAVSKVLLDFPTINAVMDENTFELVVKRDHHIGISTDTPSGLFVPVMKNVEQKSILHIAAEMNELVERTRNGNAKLEELKGGTFTMTSVGSIGGVLATPILNIPEVAILGVNAIREQAVVRNGEITIRPMMYLSPSFDHRVIDGAPRRAVRGRAQGRARASRSAVLGPPMSPTAAIQTLQRVEHEFLNRNGTPFALPLGELTSVVAGALVALDDDDWWVPGLRERVGATLRDVPIEQLDDALRGAPPYSVAPGGLSPALRALYAVGIALANPSSTTLVHLGVGSTGDGAFYEALNMAALHAVPVIFLAAIHPLDGDAPLGQQSAVSPSALAKAFDIPSQTVDGADPVAIQRATQHAKDHGGPFVIQANLPPQRETAQA